MRAYEIINEDASNKRPAKHAQAVMPRAHTVSGTKDRVYDLNRVMMAVAGADGKIKPVVSRESWTGKNNTAHPYTDIEHKMLKDAYNAIGVEWHDKLPAKSTEPDDTHRISPMPGFKGY